MRDGNCLAVCDSMHDVIGLERALKGSGQWCVMLPTPRAVSSECGMSIEFSCADKSALEELVGEGQICVTGIYEYRANQFSEIKLTGPK